MKKEKPAKKEKPEKKKKPEKKAKPGKKKKVSKPIIKKPAADLAHDAIAAPEAAVDEDSESAEILEPEVKKLCGNHLQLVALHQSLPADAKKDDYDGSCKSYTLNDPDEQEDASKISVLVDKETFYVWPVDKLPPTFVDKFNINAKESVF